MEPITEQWTEAQIMRLPDVPGKYELVEGELVVVAAGREYEDVISNTNLALSNFVKKHKLGRVYTSGIGYWMDNGNLRCPDVSFVAKKHLDDMTRDPKGFLHGSPDLAIEILSPSSRVKAMKKEAIEYFESGSRLVWLVSPDDRTVTVLRPDGTETTLSDTVDGEDVVPGFSLDVTELFEDWE